MKFLREKTVTALSAITLSWMSASAVAETLNVMAIGDSITWGYTTGDTSTGGWRSGLATNLQNLGAPNTFNFIGIKGDGNASTVTGENKGGQPNDNAAGPVHEGYSGWVIDANGPAGSKSYSDVSGTNPDPDSIFYDTVRSGIANHLRTASNTGGTIDPGNLNGNFAGPADVVMLSIGTNDVGTYTAFSSSSPFYSGPGNNAADLTAMVNVLSDLINSIVAVLPSNAKLLVSNLTPFDGDPFGVNSNGTPGNTDINTFNSLLLSELFGGSFNGDDYAAHESLSNVFLLDANSALTTPSSDLLVDNVHPTVQGYTKLANFYTDSFVSLGLTTVPEPSAALLLLLGSLTLCRRRRAA